MFINENSHNTRRLYDHNLMNIFTNYIYIIQRDLHCNGDVESIGTYTVMVMLNP